MYSHHDSYDYNDYQLKLLTTTAWLADLDFWNGPGLSGVDPQGFFYELSGVMAYNTVPQLWLMWPISKDLNNTEFPKQYRWVRKLDLRAEWGKTVSPTYDTLCGSSDQGSISM